MSPSPLPPLWIARHGQTDLNIDERWQGRLDPPLNALGLAQADALAARWRPADTPSALPRLRRIVCSPQLRARQTAAPLAQALGLEVVLDARFRERDFGIFEGLTAAEALARHPEAARAQVAWRWDRSPEGAEAVQAVVDRVAEGLQALRAEAALAQAQGSPGAVLVVCHGFVVRCLRHLLDGVSAEDFFTQTRLGNGEVLSLAW
ncbi:histidine phosphatase family protein [Ideonella livida]|uniref:Histidine phosphatase family protein n=1 Tax=Ideonella livida TaxID=2707176 RepID=A0A7C9TKW4_9BURK|nr:histidine phosphatase family protein [Ideonella livida]NDY93040.1 histidine phosphatase family protein [Ideonella livida]